MFRDVVPQLFRHAGVYGAVKSLYYSTKYTSKNDSIQLHSKVLTDIHPETNFKINNRIMIGVGHSEASHPRIGRSKFTTRPESLVSHTGTQTAHIGPDSIVYVDGDLSLGDCHIGASSRVICKDEITIEDDVSISWNFEILDDDFHQIINDGKTPPKSSPIKIKEHVWIGHDVSVLKGVTISSGSIVGSNSVVVSDVPPNTLVCGCPARVVKNNVQFEW